MNVAGLLEQFAVADNQTRQNAENQLANIMNTNFPEFVTQMLQVLVNNSFSETIRQMAGTLFKRAISSLTGQYLEEKQNNWRGMGDNIRSEIKMALIRCLADSSFCIRNAAASAISAIARIEIPINLWNSVFDDFRDIIQNGSTSVECRTACLETVRYICEDLQEFEFPESMVSSVLLLLLSCIYVNQSESVWKEAILALNPALTFSGIFMETPEQCNSVMEAVLSSLQHSDEDIQVSAFDCLDTIFYVYYEKLKPFFKTFFDLCIVIIRQGNPTTCIQAFLTFITLAQVEKERMDSNENLLGLCCACGNDLVPVLCEAMTNKDEDDDSEIMTLPTAAATCLQAFAEVMKDDLVTIVWPFVNMNINSSNWNMKEASVMIFGCMLHGPSMNILNSIISEGTGLLIDMVLQDPSVSVRDSAAWVLSQICDGFLTSVPGDKTVALIECLIMALDMEPRVGHHAALAISLICDFVADSPNLQILQPYYKTLIEKLFNISEKLGSAYTQLREAASYALISLINCRLPDTDNFLISFYQFVMDKCKMTINVQGDSEVIYSYQQFYCITLVSLLERLKGVNNPDVQALIQITFSILSSNNTSTHTQAFLLYNAVLVNVGVRSLDFVEDIMPYVVKALNTPNDISTCNAAITCLSDLLFIIDESTNDHIQKQNCYGKILRYRDEIMNSILNGIQSSNVSREIKPHLFSCLSCFFWSIPDFCIAYIPKCVNASLAACTYTISSYDEDTIEWVNQLYLAIVEFWDSCSSAQSRNPQVVLDAIPTILGFIERNLQVNYLHPELYKNCVLMLRDIVGQFKSNVAKEVFKHRAFLSLIEKCLTAGAEYEEVAKEGYNVIESIAKGSYSSW